MRVFLVDIVRFEYFNKEVHPQVVRDLGVLVGESLDDVVKKYNLREVEIFDDPLAEQYYVPNDSKANTEEKFGAMMLASKNRFFAFQLRALTLTDKDDLDSKLVEEYEMQASHV